MLVRIQAYPTFNVKEKMHNKSWNSIQVEFLKSLDKFWYYNFQELGHTKTLIL